MKRKLSQLILAASAALALTACVNFPYKAPIQQGNLIESSRVDLIRQGMSRNELANTIGSPVLKDIFHADRWDYIYTIQHHYQSHEQRRITVWFANDVVSKIERDLPVTEKTK
ncbi:MAG: outer membrane protein assembly factor BamE [Formosimonas sp.]